MQEKKKLAGAASLAQTPEVTAHAKARRGRGSGSNASGRFETTQRVLLDDGWGSLDEDLPKLRTTILRDASRTIITRNKSPDISFDRSINPYKGCEHGCIYCFARPTHAYLGLSPGLDFETILFEKPNAAQLLEQELRDPNYKPRVIAMGTNTDPYQPIERTRMITRQVLEVLLAFGHPVTIVTKSALITRDIDILSALAKRNLTKVALSVTTLDRKLSRKMEPRASTPGRRIEALKQLSDAGIPTAVMVAPVIPALNDAEIEEILERAVEVGVKQAAYIILRMPLEIKDLFREWLEEHYPDRAAHVIDLIRQMRNGKDYDAQWGKRMRGTGPYAEMIARRVHLATRRLGLNHIVSDLDVTQFKPPLKPGDQMALL